MRIRTYPKAFLILERKEGEDPQLFFAHTHIKKRRQRRDLLKRLDCIRKDKSTMYPSSPPLSRPLPSNALIRRRGPVHLHVIGNLNNASLPFRLPLFRHPSTAICQGGVQSRGHHSCCRSTSVHTYIVDTGHLQLQSMLISCEWNSRHRTRPMHVVRGELTGSAMSVHRVWWLAYAIHEYKAGCYQRMVA